jgi:hypothetical protein
MAELEAHELVITEGDVETLYLDVNEHVEPVLIVIQRGALSIVGGHTKCFRKMVKSKVTQPRILGVYDFMITVRDLRDDLIAFGVRIV